jgi:hypothetical protein
MWSGESSTNLERGAARCGRHPKHGCGRARPASNRRALCLLRVYQTTFRAVGQAFAADFVPDHRRDRLVRHDRRPIATFCEPNRRRALAPVSRESVFLVGAVFAVLGSITLFWLADPGRTRACSLSLRTIVPHRGACEPRRSEVFSHIGGAHNGRS